MKLFDTHAHIGLITEDPIDQLIITQEAKQAGVSHILSICNNLSDFFQVYQNLSTATHIYHSIGVSPSEVTHPGREWENKIEEGIKLDRIVAIGEIGLDYYRKFGDKDSQIELFIRQLELAHQFDLPVVIHNREAGRDVLEILKDKLPPKGGVLHCYSENWDFAKDLTVNNNGIFITGYSQNSNVYQYFTVNYSLTGVLNWRKQYRSYGNWNIANSICSDNFGNIYIVGSTRNANTSTITTIKYDQNGNEQWLQNYYMGGNIEKYQPTIICDNDSGIYIAGTVNNGNADF
ncbi:MAG: TatD family hydrolase, partial [Spirochaetales bacterium]|nr:TatD family hydrolase [Spirochaetales bacterium]